MRGAYAIGSCLSFRQVVRGGGVRFIETSIFGLLRLCNAVNYLVIQNIFQVWRTLEL